MQRINKGTEKAYAKINLGLRICGKREDGYHLLDTVMQTISLHDVVTVTFFSHEEEESFIPVRMSVSGASGIPLDEKNTAFRMAKSFFLLSNLKNHSIQIDIDKKIPSEAGLGGASADAAAVLRLLMRFFPNEISEKDALLLCEKIGADVPFCYQQGIGRCTGIGEKIQPLPPLSPLSVLLIKPPVGVSTPLAFSRFDQKYPNMYRRESEEKSMAMFDGSEKSFWKATGFLTNDLEAIAQTEHPVLCEIRTFLQKEGAGYTAMSGSGSCMFGIFSEKKACISAKEKAEAAFPSTFFIYNCVLGEERPL